MELCEKTGGPQSHVSIHGPNMANWVFVMF